MSESARGDLARFEQRVRDAIAANVDLMDGPPRIVERAMSAVRSAEERRRRVRRIRVALAAAAVVAGAAVAAGWRPHT